jgi:hypothetical protein
MNPAAVLETREEIVFLTNAIIIRVFGINEFVNTGDGIDTQVTNLRRIRSFLNLKSANNSDFEELYFIRGLGNRKAKRRPGKFENQ